MFRIRLYDGDARCGFLPLFCATLQYPLGGEQFGVRANPEIDGIGK
jgi:hypothetical protein